MGIRKKRSVDVKDVKYYSAEKEEVVGELIIRAKQKLDLVKKERLDLEVDINQITHYWVNAAFMLSKVEREIRQLERKFVNRTEVIKTLTQERRTDLVNERLTATEQKRDIKANIVKSALQKYREIFKAEDSVFNDYLGDKDEYYKILLENEMGIVRMTEKIKNGIVKKIIDHHLKLIFEPTNFRLLNKLYERLEDEAEKNLRLLYLVENERARSICKKGERIHDKLHKNFVETNQNVFVFEYREKLMRCQEECAKLDAQLGDLFGVYNRCLKIKDLAGKHVNKLLPVSTALEGLMTAVKEVRGRSKELDDQRNFLYLKYDYLESYMKENREKKKSLKNRCIKEIMCSRERQIKMHLALRFFKNSLEKELEEESKLVDRYTSNGDEISTLKKLYKRFMCSRLTLLDSFERSSQLCTFNISNLARMQTTNIALIKKKNEELPPIEVKLRAPTLTEQFTKPFELINYF